MSAGKSGYRTVGFRVSEQELAALDDAALEAGLSRSEYLRTCLADLSEESGSPLAHAIRLVEVLDTAVTLLWDLRQTCGEEYEMLNFAISVFEDLEDSVALGMTQDAIWLLGETNKQTLDVLEQTASLLKTIKRELGIEQES